MTRFPARPQPTLILQSDVEFKKKQAEEAKKLKELAEKAKKGPLGTARVWCARMLGGSGMKKSK